MVFLFLCFVRHVPLYGEEPSFRYPVITKLDPGDAVFRQYQQDVEQARAQLIRGGRILPGPAGDERRRELAESLTMFAYIPEKGEDVLSIAARCMVPAGSIATLNGLSHLGELREGVPLLLPSIPGLFISEKPSGDLETLLYAAREESGGVFLSMERQGRREKVRFLPGEDFNGTERVFFLDAGYRFPLQHFRLSSDFGPRINPVTGRPGQHRGLDLAAPQGTPVFAAKRGRVSETGENAIYGKYVIISHEDGRVSLYGHLSKIEVLLQDYVEPGNMIIGRVGSTGQSTGPHLHFEIRQNGKAQDPKNFLRLFQGD